MAGLDRLGSEEEQNPKEPEKLPPSRSSRPEMPRCRVGRFPHGAGRGDLAAVQSFCWKRNRKERERSLWVGEGIRSQEQEGSMKPQNEKGGQGEERGREGAERQSRAGGWN